MLSKLLSSLAPTSQVRHRTAPELLWTGVIGSCIGLGSCVLFICLFFNGTFFFPPSGQELIQISQSTLQDVYVVGGWCWETVTGFLPCEGNGLHHRGKVSCTVDLWYSHLLPLCPGSTRNADRHGKHGDFVTPCFARERRASGSVTKYALG